MAGEAVLEAIAAERQEARGWLKRLDAAEAAIKGRSLAAPPKPIAGPPPRQKRKGKGATTSPAEALARQAKVHRFIAEQGGLVAPKDIRAATGLSENTFRTAASRLVEAGKLRREGDRQFTRYESIKSPTGDAEESPTAPPPSAPPQGTLVGRVLATIQSCEFATVDELADLLDEDPALIESQAGSLIREEEIRMERRNGRVGYVLSGAGV